MSAEKAAMQRWRCVCAYDGTDFAGWQSQAGGNSVQDKIEARLKQIFSRDIRIHGSGRTDAGVHALQQVFHFDAAWPHGEEKLLAAFRAGLPPAIQVRSARPAASDFHARFDATGKIYFYQLYLGMADPFQAPFCWSAPGPLNVKRMQATAARLTGRHDFRAFAALNGPPREDTVKDLRRLEITQRGARLKVTAEASGFLYKMVRSLVGTLVDVGLGKLAPDEVVAILESRKRTNQVRIAPPQGLFLARVFYR